MQKIFLPGELIREIRKRKRLRQIFMLDCDKDSLESQVTLSRIENLRQNPSKLSLTDLLSKVALPYKQFFCPYMEAQRAETFVLRRQIVYLLDRAEGDETIISAAQELIDSMKNALNLESLVNKQLWLSLQTELDTIAGRGDEHTLNQIREGIQITYPEFDEQDFHGDILIFYECELMLSLARGYANRGDLDFALFILARLKEGYQKQPLNEMCKEILLNESQNLTVRYLLKKGDYPAALTASEEAITMCKRISGSTRMPDAVYLRAMALFHGSGDVKQAALLLQQAYFAYARLKRTVRQKQVLLSYREITGDRFETYHTEKIDFVLPTDFYQFKAGDALAAHDIGALLRQFRLTAGAKQSEVYSGICSRGFYSRIESGERTNVSFFILEALMQRLGRSIDLYLEYFTSIQEWEEYRLRMQYLREASFGNMADAKKTLARLMEIGDFTQGLGKQFLLYAQALVKESEGKIDESVDLLYQAIRITIPDFNEERIGNTRLTYHECNIIDLIAALTANHLDNKRGIAIFLALRDSLNRFYVDDNIKAQYYTDLLNTLTNQYYNLGKYQEALEFARECETICYRHDVLFLLNINALSIAKCLHKLGQKEESIAYAAMAYFSGALTAQKPHMEEIETFAKEELGIAFSRDLGFVYYKENIGVFAN